MKKLSLLRPWLMPFALTVALASGLVTPPASADVILPPELTIFDETFGDMPDELLSVVDENKKALLIMFETDDCPWCLRMKQTVLNRQRVQDYFKQHFRIISINAEGGAPIVDFDGQETSETRFSLKLLRVRATPVFAFFDSAGNLLAKYTGTTKNADDFLLLGEFVVGDHYRNGKFSKYRRAHAENSAS